jgi:decaprenylphospho-beta-D-erythro-pentofuranosid-2-ulose 2-reductase
MTVLLIGATSRILEDIARIHAARGDILLLAGRDTSRLQTMVNDLKLRGASGADLLASDLAELNSHETLASWLGKRSIDRAYMGHGVLYPQDRIEKDLQLAHGMVTANYESYVRLGLKIGALMAAQGHGDLAILGSVAGLRGKQSNLVYASSLAARNTFADGLRHRLVKKGVRICTLLLGFVDTPMTKEFKKGALWLSSDSAAKKIVTAVDRKKTKVYIPGFWRFLMWIIRAIPEPLFLRTGL